MEYLVPLVTFALVASVIVVGFVLPPMFVFHMRKKRPEDYKTAMILSVVCGPYGHFYLGKGGMWWVILAAAVPFVVSKVYGGTLVPWVVCILFSVMLMHYRFQRKIINKSY